MLPCDGPVTRQKGWQAGGVETKASNEFGVRGKMFGNLYNWLAFARVFSVFRSPLSVLVAILRKSVPPSVEVRTPTGIHVIALRNFESLKTTFSIFCRKDYGTTAARPFHFLDVGANIGTAAVYFLSRHPGNTVRCFEPDAANLPFLHRNLAPFGDRATIVEKAVGAEAGAAILFRSEDGKYSSLIDQGQASGTQPTEIVKFESILVEAEGAAQPIVVKVDIEGLEEELVKSVDFSTHPRIVRLIVESTGCSRLVARAHRRTLHADYVEDLAFE